MIASSFASMLFSTTSSRGTSLEPTPDPAFLMSLFSLLAVDIQDRHRMKPYGDILTFPIFLLVQKNIKSITYPLNVCSLTVSLFRYPPGL